MRSAETESQRRLDAAFEAFVEVSSARLLRTAYLLCGDRDEAEDLLQMTLIRTGRRWEVARSAPDAYAYRVLINLVHDRRRRLRRRMAETAMSEFDDARFVVPDSSPGLLDRSVLMDAARGLPERQREVIVLRFFADLSVEQTAQAMDASSGTVKTHTSRALAALREALTEQPIRSTTRQER
jgi:RNA polymerase sigma-70 factor (sigma-E family)